MNEKERKGPKINPHNGNVESKIESAEMNQVFSMPVMPYFIVALVMCLFAIIFPLILKYCVFKLAWKEMGQIGDIIAGTTAPFLNFATLFMILVTFYAQKKSYDFTLHQFQVAKADSDLQSKYSELQFKYSQLQYEEQQRLRTTENRPLMLISNVEANILSDSNTYPVYIRFLNSGKGIAKIRVVDLEDENMKAHLGTPISVAPNYESYIKVWLNSQRHEHEIKLSLYYWDADDNGYKTDAKLHVAVDISPKNFFYAEWRMDSENIVEISQDLKLPMEVKNWPRDGHFEKS